MILKLLVDFLINSTRTLIAHSYSVSSCNSQFVFLKTFYFKQLYIVPRNRKWTNSFTVHFRPLLLRITDRLFLAIIKPGVIELHIRVRLA
jgi:hypothetical protein